MQGLNKYWCLVVTSWISNLLSTIPGRLRQVTLSSNGISLMLRWGQNNEAILTKVAGILGLGKHLVIYACIYRYVYVRPCISVYSYKYIYMNIYGQKNEIFLKYVAGLLVLGQHLCIHAYVYVCMYIHICIHLYTYIYIYVFMYTIYRKNNEAFLENVMGLLVLRKHLFIHTYVYTYMYIYILKCLHITHIL